MHTLTNPRISVVDGEAADRSAPGSPSRPSKLDRFVGKSARWARAVEKLEALAELDVPVLFVGERGTGKSLAARALHDLGRRAERPFRTLRCGALPAALVESALLGRGAGDAASRATGGLLEGTGGTLFLDEIEALAPSMQAIVARVATAGRLDSGAGSPVPVDVRVVAASRRPPSDALAEGLLRTDLAEALSVAAIELPPLRDRIEDLPLLAYHFLERAVVGRTTRVASFSDEALERLMDHDWPGNVGELEALIERLVLLVRREEITVQDLPDAIRAEPALRTWAPRVPATGIDFNDVVERFENDLIAQALDRTRWNKNRAARLLGLNRTTLVEKIKKRGLKPPASLR